MGRSGDDAEKERHYLNVALAERVGGVIAPCSDSTDLTKLAVAGIAIAVVDRALAGRPCDTVLTDNRAGGRLAATQLEAAGRRRIACIAGPRNPTSGARLKSFLSHARRSGSMEVAAVASGNNRIDGGYAAMRQVIEGGIDFDAVFTTNNLMAVGAVKVLDDLMPLRRQEIGLVGFDLSDIPLLGGSHIASVDQDPREMGRLAGERVLAQQTARQQGRSEPRVTLELIPSLVRLRWGG